MDSYKKFLAFLFSLLVSIVAFFLFMFYKKVDAIGDNVNKITISNAVSEEKTRSIEKWRDNVELRITTLESKVYK